MYFRLLSLPENGVTAVSFYFKPRENTSHEKSAEKGRGRKDKFAISHDDQPRLAEKWVSIQCLRV